MSRAAAVLAALALAMAGGAGCGDRRSVTDPPHERADDPSLDEALLVALAQARNYHHQADVHLADGNPEAAIAAVAGILRIRFPAGAAEAEDTMLDARARLAKLYLAAGRLDEAQRVVDEGLAAPRRESFFLANLHAVAGEVHEARARALAATDPAAAHEERRRAIAAYDRSIQVNDRVQRNLLQEARP